MTYINNMSKLNMIDLFILIPFPKVIWSWFIIKIMIRWGQGKFEALWHGPYVIMCILKKGSYELANYEGNALVEPENGLYLKKYYT